MSTSSSGTDSFALARQKKRTLFQEHWNSFLKHPLFSLQLLLLLLAQMFFLLSSVGFIRHQAIALTLVSENYAVWYNVIFAAIALLLSLPGFGFLFGLWQIRRKAHWQGDGTPDISGVKLIKLTNIILCIITGIALALYPTIIISAGEYLQEGPLFRLFCLLLASTLMFVLCVTLLRIVIRTAEENITCCWSNASCLLPLILIMAAISAAALIFLPEPGLFFISVAVLAGFYTCFLFFYWLFLRRVTLRQAEIDRQTIADRENPNDPYQRY